MRDNIFEPTFIGGGLFTARLKSFSLKKIDCEYKMFEASENRFKLGQKQEKRNKDLSSCI